MHPARQDLSETDRWHVFLQPEGGMTRPGSEWSIAAQPSESLPDEAPLQTTPPKILRRDLPATPPSMPRAAVQPQQGRAQQHAGGPLLSLEQQQLWQLLQCLKLTLHARAQPRQRLIQCCVASYQHLA